MRWALGSALWLCCPLVAGCGDGQASFSDLPSSTSGSGGSFGAAPGSGGHASTQNGLGSTGGTIGGAAAGKGGGDADKAGRAGNDPENDCSSAAEDSCPVATGLSFACKQRFALGVNYAWRNFGADFGGLAQFDVQGPSMAREVYANDLKAMRDSGASVVRWWMFPDLRGDAISFDAGDDATGISALALSDLNAALELADAAGVYLALTLFSFDGFSPTHEVDGISLRGLTGIVTSPARRERLVERVVRPLARAAAQSPHARRLIGWDIINEPEWAIQPDGRGDQDFTPSEQLDSVPLADMRAFIDEIAEVLEQETPRAFRSIGSAAAKWSWAFSALNLTVNQPHIYAWVNEYWPYTLAASELGYPERPTIMGHVLLADMPFAESGDDAPLSAILDAFYANGYAGAWPWQQGDQAPNLPLLAAFAAEKGCSASF